MPGARRRARAELSAAIVTFKDPGRGKLEACRLATDPIYTCFIEFTNTASEKSAHANNPSTRAISGSEATLCQTLKASKADGLTSIETTIECIRTLLPRCNCHIASQYVHGCIVIAMPELL